MEATGSRVQARQAGEHCQAALEAPLADVLLQHHALVGELSRQQALPHGAVPASHDLRNQVLQGDLFQPFGRAGRELQSHFSFSDWPDWPATAVAWQTAPTAVRRNPWHRSTCTVPSGTPRRGEAVAGSLVTRPRAPSGR